MPQTSRNSWPTESELAAMLSITEALVGAGEVPEIHSCYDCHPLDQGVVQAVASPPRYINGRRRATAINYAPRSIGTSAGCASCTEQA